VAHNTTVVSYNEDKTFTKSKILFVGTLYKQKKIFELLEAYHKASKIIETIMPLDIIGDGDDFAAVKKWITNRNLDEKVNLLGSIYDHAILEMHFRSSYACISPGQAGLSVLTSMGYGTPYITMNEAITGGEIFNIVNNENGILYKKDDDLTSLIIDINTNPTKYLAMGARARKHYLDNRRMDLMLKGFSDAIEFVSQKRSKASK
jgi:glycosyltransferase involved in cell wall biosynthesis